MNIERPNRKLTLWNPTSAAGCQGARHLCSSRSRTLAGHTGGTDTGGRGGVGGGGANRFSCSRPAFSHELQSFSDCGKVDGQCCCVQVQSVYKLLYCGCVLAAVSLFCSSCVHVVCCSAPCCESVVVLKFVFYTLYFSRCSVLVVFLFCVSLSLCFSRVY